MHYQDVMQQEREQRGKPRAIPRQAVVLVEMAVWQPETLACPFLPSWLNTWEAALYQRALRHYASHGWLFKRFGASAQVPIYQRLSATDYRQWLSLLEKIAVEVFDKVVRQTPHFQQTKQSLFYFDAWGDSALLDQAKSWRDALSVDMVPLSIVQKYRIDQLTSRLRGERTACLQAIQLAQDHLYSGAVDQVWLVGYFRAFPFLVFSEGLQSCVFHSSVQKAPPQQMAQSVERLTALVLQAQRGDEQQQLLVAHRAYYRLAAKQSLVPQLLEHWLSLITADTQLLVSVTSANLRYQQQEQQSLQQLQQQSGVAGLSLTARYGDSGCLNPALALRYLQRYFTEQAPARALSHALISCLDNQGGLWLLDCWWRGATC